MEQNFLVDIFSDSDNFSAQWKSNSSIVLFCGEKFFLFHGIDNSSSFILNLVLGFSAAPEQLVKEHNWFLLYDGEESEGTTRKKKIKLNNYANGVFELTGNL